jgi:hypothetical protein
MNLFVENYYKIVKSNHSTCWFLTISKMKEKVNCNYSVKNVSTKMTKVIIKKNFGTN